MAKFLLDKNLPKSLLQALIDAGHEVLAARTAGLGGKSDAEVFSYAQQHSCILITRDQGFGNPLQYPPG